MTEGTGGERVANAQRGAAALLRFEAVAVTLAGRKVLRGVSFDVYPGEVVGLLGRNGAGKTTLLRVAACGIQPDSGAVYCGDAPVRALGRRELARRVAVVPQETQVPFPFRVGELVLMGRAPHGRPLGFESHHDRERAQRAMERVGIEPLADRSVFELSGGERQLTIFARALAQDPDVLLLDEPTAFLDLKHRVEVLRIVREFVGTRRAALVVSHDLSLAARACDRLVLLTEGRVAIQGLPAEVLTVEALRQGFGVHTDVIAAPDGTPVVVPRVFDNPDRPAPGSRKSRVSR